MLCYSFISGSLHLLTVFVMWRMVLRQICYHRPHILRSLPFSDTSLRLRSCVSLPLQRSDKVLQALKADLKSAHKDLEAKTLYVKGVQRNYEALAAFCTSEFTHAVISGTSVLVFLSFFLLFFSLSLSLSPSLSLSFLSPFLLFFFLSSSLKLRGVF